MRIVLKWILNQNSQLLLLMLQWLMETANDTQFWGKHVRPAARPTFWAILYRDNGSLEFLSLPDFTLKYVVLNFHMGE